MKTKTNYSVNFLISLALVTCLLAGLWSENLITSLHVYLPETPFFYILAFCLLLVLFIEALIKISKPWALPSIIIYATTLIWYLIDPLYFPEHFREFSKVITEDAYLQIIIFLAYFRLLLPQFSKKIVSQNTHLPQISSQTFFTPSQILFYISIIWIGLLLFGINRMNGDIFGALFPIYSRAGVNMWQRGASASAGDSGFIVSSASYTYLLVCSFFGILLPLQTKGSAKLINLVLILISWPYFLLMGARNQFLAVACPSYFSYILVSRQKWWVKILITAVAFMALNYVFTIIVAYRNVGFSAVFNDVSQALVSKPKQKHVGLNMVEELCFINSFYKQKALHLSYGGGYIAELLNFIPRALWPDKPLLGIDYAILRGFGGNRSKDIGVFATISTGFIGQGVINFGPYFGPLAPALLMSLWASFLARLWSQRYSILRLCLFLAGLGITFNLGRDISLLVLWPMFFGYVLVRIIEQLNKKKLQYRSLNY